jgi:hypothetical protein
MTLQLLHSEFPYIEGKFDFLFYQCSSSYTKFTKDFEENDNDTKDLQEYINKYSSMVC